MTQTVRVVDEVQETTKPVGRAAFIERQNNAWKQTTEQEPPKVVGREAFIERQKNGWKSNQ